MTQTLNESGFNLTVGDIIVIKSGNLLHYGQISRFAKNRIYYYFISARHRLKSSHEYYLTTYDLENKIAIPDMNKLPNVVKENIKNLDNIKVKTKQV